MLDKNLSREMYEYISSYTERIKAEERYVYSREIERLNAEIEKLIESRGLAAEEIGRLEYENELLQGRVKTEEETSKDLSKKLVGIRDEVIDKEEEIRSLKEKLLEKEKELEKVGQRDEPTDDIKEAGRLAIDLSIKEKTIEELSCRLFDIMTISVEETGEEVTIDTLKGRLQRIAGLVTGNDYRKAEQKGTNGSNDFLTFEPTKRSEGLGVFWEDEEPEENKSEDNAIPVEAIGIFTTEGKDKHKFVRRVVGNDIIAPDGTMLTVDDWNEFRRLMICQVQIQKWEKHELSLTGGNLLGGCSILGIDWGDKKLLTFSNGYVFDKDIEYIPESTRKAWIGQIAATIHKWDTKVVVVEGGVGFGSARQHKGHKSVLFLYEICQRLKEYGIGIVSVKTTFPSSHICSNCGVPIINVAHVCSCSVCDSVIDRDLNASLNLAQSVFNKENIDYKSWKAVEECR